ncbi:MAG: TRAP transporter small permease subunit [Desulfobacteraceae bacterium]|nr:TRAP transporter small permease subunit [Desulfobacteraceae bacterium]
MINKICKGIDGVQDWFGYITAMLIFPMTAIIIYEVFMRYIFNRPTSWGFELTTYIYGMHFMLGLGYTLLYNGHVRVEVFLTLLSRRKQKIISVLCHLILLLPVFSLFCYASWSYAWTSVVRLEKSWTSWAPPLYPFKLLMALGFLMFVIQGVSSLLKEIQALRELK